MISCTVFLNIMWGGLNFLAVLHRDASIAHYRKCIYQSISRTEAALSNTTEHTGNWGLLEATDSKEMSLETTTNNTELLLNLMSR